MTASPLKGCTLIVTRPSGQAGSLIRTLEEAGARVVHFPAIQITAIDESQDLLTHSLPLDSYDIAIFISRNAVSYGIPLLTQKNWPSNTRIAAIGNGTARQIQKLGFVPDIISTTTASSEGLLSEVELNSVNKKRILIIRGKGGREKLADTLKARGAKVDYFECYKRTLPDNDNNILSRLWDKDTLHGIILTSAEGLKNLYQMVNKKDLPRLNRTPLYVISSTMVELCKDLGYKSIPVLMHSASDDDVLESVTGHCKTKAI